MNRVNWVLVCLLLLFGFALGAGSLAYVQSGLVVAAAAPDPDPAWIMEGDLMGSFTFYGRSNTTSKGERVPVVMRLEISKARPSSFVEVGK